MKDIKVKFSQNFLYHMKDDLFCIKKANKKNDFSWVFTERVTNYWSTFDIICINVNVNILQEINHSTICET